MEIPINYLAVFCAAVAVMIISFAWYGPLFGKRWMALVGMESLSPEQMEAGKKAMPKNSAIQFVGALVMAWVFAHALAVAAAYLGIGGISAGLTVGFMTWLGFIVPVSVGTVLWEGRPWTLWFIVAGGWLVNLLAIGVVLAWWV